MWRNDPNRATMNLNVAARRWFKLTMRQRWNGHNPRPRRQPIHQLLGTCHMYHHMYHHVLYLFDSIDTCIGNYRDTPKTNNTKELRKKFPGPQPNMWLRLSEMSMSFGCRDQNVLEPSYGRFSSDDFVWKWLVPLNPMVLLIIIPTKWLFTPLRVGWPPTPQVISVRTR